MWLSTDYNKVISGTLDSTFAPKLTMKIQEKAVSHDGSQVSCQTRELWTTPRFFEWPVALTMIALALTYSTLLCPTIFQDSEDTY